MLIKSRTFVLVSALTLGATAQAADGLTVGGFVNPTYQWARNEGGADGNSFRINDGALYLGKTLGMGQVFLDMPFKVGNNPLDTGNNDVLAGFDQAQAFVQWKYENGFMWKLGQFDTLYGFESNDSIDRFFSQTGLLYAKVPVTHTGLQIGYSMSDALSVHFLVANPADRGVMTDGNPDFGLKLVTTSDAFSGSVGAHFSRVVGVDDLIWLVDIIAGTKMDAISADLEVLLNKEGDDTGVGILAMLGYSIDENLSAGLRGEWRKVGDAKNFRLAIGPKSKLNESFSLGLEYYLDKVDGIDAGHSLALSAIGKF